MTRLLDYSSTFGHLHHGKFAKKYIKFAKVVSNFCPIEKLAKTLKILPKSGHTGSWLRPKLTSSDIPCIVVVVFDVVVVAAVVAVVVIHIEI